MIECRMKKIASAVSIVAMASLALTGAAGADHGPPHVGEQIVEHAEQFVNDTCRRFYPPPC